MIKINKSASYTTAAHEGVVTASVVGSDKTEWEFQLLKTTNGSTKYEVVINENEVSLPPESKESLKKTVMANIEKEQITWI